ncbi:2-heptaprenyl- -naphthoquinone [Fusarium langsethiae]|uniref:2-heptaprenyl--naphthoquinone n=1 Tax=Fusarium langsethiae TaxID=179993 RepID=A0A0M9EV50_FUSLA|nr:2-heptaprenyl- -naphthoquinone [Fusarium langsethiae]
MTDLVSENQAYFGKIANEYDQRNADAIVQLERSIQDRIPFIGIKQDGRLLDYACGTGMLSRVGGSIAGEAAVLAQHTSEAIGIDLSEDMVNVYNAQAQNQSSSRQAFQGNLADPTDASPAAFTDAKFFDFDVAGVGLGFHHFDKPDLASKRLAERLRPGGVLFIIDFVAYKIDPKDAAKRGIAHHGFSEEQIRKMFEDAGLTNFAYQELPEPIAFKDPMGHGHSHGHGHGHGGRHIDSKHEHGEVHDDNKGHSMTKRVFIARASKF